uniref:NADH dehydrogenase [ubiquinone] 1 beta subcomplex subunit 11, mitochondrial n=1 Tax=Acrobeloides nanus TaxID=290746 RepID=A0A914D1C6_9BILA
MLLCVGLRPQPLRCFLFVRNYASQSSHNDHHEVEPKIERKPDLYRPGSDSYAYENPWPKLNKGRLDWLFQDGWRRPLTKDQGAKMRREWIPWGQVMHDEYKDWATFHQFMFLIGWLMIGFVTVFVYFLRSDWPTAKEWALREAHLEMVRREKAGLPYISKDLVDPKRVATQLPSDEELRDFDIVI